MKNDEPDAQSKSKCIFHGRKSGCRLGDACKYLHEGPSGASQAEAQATQAQALLGAEAQKANAKAKAKAKPAAKAAASSAVMSSFAGMIRSSPPETNPFPHRQIHSWPLWMCELISEPYQEWQQTPFGMTGYLTKLELDRFSQKRLDLEANLWIHLNESELEMWIEGWIDGVGVRMYSDGLIEAQIGSAWQRGTCVHEPGFLVATGLDSDEPVYRVLVLLRC